MAMAKELGKVDSPATSIVVVDNDNLFVVTAHARELVRVSKQTGATAKRQNQVQAILRAGNQLFFSTYGSFLDLAVVRKCALPECSDSSLTTTGYASYLADATGFGANLPLAWVDVPGTKVVLGNGPINQTVTSSAKLELNAHIRRFEDAIYWNEGGGTAIGRLTSAGAKATLSVAPHTPGDFAVHGTTATIFFFATATRQLVRGTISGAEVRDLQPIANNITVDEIAIDGTKLFVLATDGLLTCDVTSCAEMKLLAGTPDAETRLQALAIDATTVWYGDNTGRLWGVTRP